jgi:hypothetical protein
MRAEPIKQTRAGRLVLTTGLFFSAGKGEVFGGAEYFVLI